MKDQTQKIEMIHSIEQLQLSNHLIYALEDAHQAESIIQAIHDLKRMCTEWH